MTLPLASADILAQVPGWEDARLEPVSGGFSNNTWKVTAGNKIAILKIDDEPREPPLNTRCDEAYVQNMASKAGLAAPVILANTGFYFSEFLQGTVWTRDCLDRPGNLEMIAEALKRLHALPLTGRSFDASVAAKRYVRTISGLDGHVVERCREIISSMRLPQNLCCCHNDLVAENLVTTPELRFIDWEYACDNDPFFDLATIVEHHQLSDDQVSRLLDVYLDGGGNRWRAHLEKQRKLYLALLCLWMGSRPNTDPSELNAVVERLLTSCS